MVTALTRAADLLVGRRENGKHAMDVCGVRGLRKSVCLHL